MIYLDNASTTALDPLVLEAMMPYFKDAFQNASSNHLQGQQIKTRIEESRKLCADLINAKPDEIIFTSGSTEAINYALKGYLEENFDKGNHIITCKTEHKAVLKTCEYLESKGVDVTYLSVNTNGEINYDELQDSISENTALIALMLVNNENGVIHNIKKVCEIAHSKEVDVFCDATQAVGKMPIDVEDLGVDMMSMSAHKINGPKGIGFLYVKQGIQLTPLIHGGSQENDNRGGTYNSPLIIGLGKTVELAKKNIVQNANHINDLYAYLKEQVSLLPNIAELSRGTDKVTNIVNLKINNLDTSVFVEGNKEISLSNGSACTSQIIEGSHVLKAMGLSDMEANECVRISFDKNSAKEEIDVLIKQFKSLC